jgi:hypothetical protein
MSAALEQTRAQIAARLRERRAEIEQATLARVYGVQEPGEAVEPEYLHGLREAVSAALEYAIAATEAGEDRSPPIPVALLAQARLAARNRISLDVVLRRYFSGFTLFNDFVVQEAGAEIRGDGPELRRLLGAQGVQLERIVSAIAEEYGREAASSRHSSNRQRRLERVRRLLAGEAVDAAELNYELAGWHIALVLCANEDGGFLHDLARELDRRLLAVSPQPGVEWAWLGGRRRLDCAKVSELATERLGPGCLLAVGEPAYELAGWRLTHKQARDIAPFAETEERPVVTYGAFGLLAAVARDEVLSTSLRERYLAPLARERDDGEALRATLKAYLAARANVTATAAAIGVSRQTVRSRLEMVEQRLGCSLDECAIELDVAMRLQEDPVGTVSGSLAGSNSPN